MSLLETGVYRRHLAILGYGGHGRDIEASLCCLKVDRYDDSQSVYSGQRFSHFAGDCDFIIGVNDSRQRRSIAERLRQRGITSEGQWTHPRAAIGPDVDLGEHVHINAGVTITRTTVGAFTTISPGANICGDVSIGETVTIGAGAVVCQFCTIGDGATIAAGAVLPPHTNVPCNETWGGVPAKRLS